ncbi:MAG: DUF3137 domain-containing protein [Halobacteriota archaeon]|nr:DUF3137 domain-containing protein [Halobacteriota archaeon]
MLNKKLREEWKLFAGNHSLDFDPGSTFKTPKVEGSYRGHNVILDTYTVSTGQVTVVYTRLKVDLKNNKRVSLRVYHEGFFSKIGKRLGMQDIETKNSEFDGMYVVKGNDEIEVLSILDSSVQSKILSLREPGKFNMTLKDGSLIYEESGISTDIELLRSHLEILIYVAEKIDAM